MLSTMGATCAIGKPAGSVHIPLNGIGTECGGGELWLPAFCSAGIIHGGCSPELRGVGARRGKLHHLWRGDSGGG